jgi:hypothetical protein
METLTRLKPLPETTTLSRVELQRLVRAVWSRGFRCGVTEGEQRATDYERGGSRREIEEGEAFIDEINYIQGFDVFSASCWEEL